MATRIAAPGGGNWTVGGTWIGGVAPTAADDAQLIATSGAVTIDTGAVARSLDCTGYTGTLTHTAGVTLVLGDATAGAGNVALKLVAGMTYTLANVTSSSLRFNSTSATQQTIDPGGKNFGITELFGIGSSYILAGAMATNAAATVTLQAGTFNSGNFAMSLGLLVLSGATAKTLTLGSSAIAITGNSNTAVNYTGSNLTMTANTAVMTFSGAGAGMSGILNWNGTSAVFNSTVTSVILTGPTLNNVTWTGPSSTRTAFITVGANLLSTTGTLTLTANSTINRILVQSSVTGTARTVTVGTGFSFANVDFSDITAAGAAGTWIGTSMGDALGNSNITFDAPTTQTHTASAGGNWSDITKWTSRVPLPQDNVVVDVNTTGTLTADMPRLGADITFAGFAGTAAFNSTANTLYGSLVLGAGMTLSGTQGLTLAARSSKTITSNGKQFTQAVTIGAPSSAYTLQDAFSTAGGLVSTTGTLTGNNQNVTASFFNNSGSATTSPGSGTWTITTTLAAFWAINSGTFSGATSTIILATATATARTFAGGGQTYGTLTYTAAGSTGSLTVTGANIFTTMNFSDVTNARTLTLPASTITTCTNFMVVGSAGKLMTVNSSSPGVTATLAITSLSAPDYLSLQDITATGTAYGGAHTTVGTNVSGFMFQKLAAPGGGNWTAGATWVGGVAPLASDAVVFDAASGAVTVDAGAVARAADFTGYSGTLTHTASIVLSLGDAITAPGRKALVLSAGMTYAKGNDNSVIAYVSTSATQQSITTAGKAMGGFQINGAGSSYILGDTITIGSTANARLSAGTFNTGNFACSWGMVLIDGATAKTLTLGSSAIAVTGNASNTVNYSGSNLTVTANTAVMTLSGATADFNGGINWNGLSLVFTATNTTLARLQGSTVAVNNVTLTGPANKVGQFFIGSAATVTGALTVNGNSTVNRVLMSTGIVGTTRTVTAAAVSLSNVDFMDIVAAGAIPWTGTSLGNALGNSNITFDPSVTQTRSGVGGNYSAAGQWTSRVPLPQDNVIIPVAATGTITMDMPRLGADVDFTGFTGTAALGVTVTNYGSVNLASGMTLSGAFAWTLSARSAKTITSNGKAFSNGVSVTAPGGTYTLSDAFSSTVNSLTVNAGTFDTASLGVTTGIFTVASGATFTGGTSTFTLTSTSAVQILGFSSTSTTSAANTTFVIANTSANPRTVGSGGKTIGTLTYTVAGSTGSLTITATGTINTINFSDASNARSLLFTPATSTTFTNWKVLGTAGKLMTVDGASAGTYTLVKAGGGITVSDYLAVANSTATPGSTWYAGSHSTNGGGNTGWLFADAPQLNATAALTLPALTAAAAGTIPLTATAALILPKLTAFAFGTVVANGTAVLYLPLPVVAAVAKVAVQATAALTLPKLTAAATGSATAGASAPLQLPGLQLAATGSVSAVPGPPEAWMGIKATGVRINGDGCPVLVADSRQWLGSVLEADDPINQLAIEAAIFKIAPPEEEDWHTATWAPDNSNMARILVGPGTEVGKLDPGVWKMRVRIIEYPEFPQLDCGTFKVVS